MAKPSIAELLNASGYTTYTAELVQRAMFTLYGNVGANQDGRNWAAILQSNNPLEAAEAGLRAMYQDGAYLRSNPSTWSIRATWRRRPKSPTVSWPSGWTTPTTPRGPMAPRTTTWAI